MVRSAAEWTLFIIVSTRISRARCDRNSTRASTGQGEHEGRGDRHPGDELGLLVLAGAYGAQHGQGVGERREEERQGRLDVPVRGEGSQQAWGELAACQLQRQHGEREGQRRDRDE